MKRVLAICLVLTLVQAASAGMVISEWLYSGSDGEFVEFTNTGPDAIDMTGWSFDDDSAVPGTVDLSAFGLVETGESVVLTEAVAGDFVAAWGLSGVSVIGELSANLGRADQINLYDASDVLIDELTYDDETYAGTPRTKDESCNIPASDYDYTIAQATWENAAVGDAFGSWMSSGGDIGSPGQVPEPASFVLLALGGLMIGRRRR